MPDQNSAKPLNIAFIKDGETFNDTAVDGWELKAARRILMNLKTLLQGQPMLDLIADQIEEGDKFHRNLVATSNGEYRESHIDLRVEGFSGKTLIQSLGKQMASGVDAKAQFAAHPEHYALPLAYMGMVETIGAHPTRFKVSAATSLEGLPEAVAAFADPSYPLTMVGKLRLEDDTPFAFAIHQLRDTDDGSCEIALRLIYPKAAPDFMIEEHAEHLAIEFRSYIRQALAEG